MLRRNKDDNNECTLKRLRAFSTEMYVSLPGDASVRHFDGETKDGKPHGFGLALFHDGSRFAGQWVNGVRHGRGVFDSKDNGSYDGDWSGDLYHGQGKRIYDDGCIYIGEWKEAKRHGTGTLSTRDFKYEGPWVGDSPFGTSCHYTSGGFLRIMTKPSGSNSSSPTFPSEFFAEKTGGGIKQYEGPIHNERGRHGRGRTEYKNGMVYHGEYVMNKRNGKGSCVYENGDRYEGEWAGDQRNGKGVQVYSHGGRYEGDWCKDMKEGQGSRDYHNGDKYHGEWLKDEVSGKGTMVYRNNDEYTGDWKAGKRHGMGQFKFHKQCAEYTGPLVNGLIHTGESGLVHGKMKYQNGDIFIGHFIKGERTKGIMWSNDGSVYSGDCKYDKAHGKGIMWHDGSFFYGTWHRGVQSGTGCKRYADKSEYVGGWKDKMRTGQGTLQREDKTVVHGLWENDEPTVHYDGQWQDQLFHGVGKYCYANGSSYYGIWSAGHKYNIGTILFKDTGKYQGGMLNDLPHGNGLLTYPNKSTYAGAWQEGIRNGQGSLFDSEGNVFSGTWTSNQQNGPGLYYVADKCVMQAEWVDSKVVGEVITHFSNGRIVKSLYVDGCEQSGIMSKALRVVNEPFGTACKGCNVTFGMTRWKYLCIGCRQPFCTACLKEVKYCTKFSKFTYDPPNGDKTLDGKACSQCNASAAAGASILTVWDGKEVSIGTVVGKKFNGNIQRHYASGNVYVGEMKDDKEEGRGNLLNSDGTEYTGQFKGGTKSGHGYLRNLDGTVCEGVFENDILLKTQYRGEMKRVTTDGKPESITVGLERHGRGEAWYIDGGYYNGEHASGARNGVGEMKYPNGDCYIGEWQAGTRNGRGRFTADGKSVYTGMWKQDQKHGRGFLTDTVTSLVYEAEWCDDEVEGIVVIRKPGGVISVEVWEKGIEKSDVFKPPAMAADTTSLICNGCERSFTFVRRRHHCRGCGLLFCHDCTSKTRVFPSHFKHQSSQRICSKCNLAIDIGMSVRYVFTESGLETGTWRNGTPHGPHLIKKKSGESSVLHYDDGKVGSKPPAGAPTTEQDFTTHFNTLCEASLALLTYPSPELEKASAVEVNATAFLEDILAKHIPFTPENSHRTHCKPALPQPPVPPPMPMSKPVPPSMLSEEAFSSVVKNTAEGMIMKAPRQSFTLEPPTMPPAEVYAEYKWNTWGPEQKFLKETKHTLSASSVAIAPEKKFREENKLLQAVAKPISAATSVVTTPVAALSNIANRREQNQVPVSPGPTLPYPLADSWTHELPSACGYALSMQRNNNRRHNVESAASDEKEEIEGSNEDTEEKVDHKTVVCGEGTKEEEVEGGEVQVALEDTCDEVEGVVEEYTAESAAVKDAENTEPGPEQNQEKGETEAEEEEEHREENEQEGADPVGHTDPTAPLLSQEENEAS